MSPKLPSWRHEGSLVWLSKSPHPYSCDACTGGNLDAMFLCGLRLAVLGFCVAVVTFVFGPWLFGLRLRGALSYVVAAKLTDSHFGALRMCCSESKRDA